MGKWGVNECRFSILKWNLFGVFYEKQYGTDRNEIALICADLSFWKEFSKIGSFHQR